jgi:hypothetical protein
MTHAGWTPGGGAAVVQHGQGFEPDSVPGQGVVPDQIQRGVPAAFA